MYNRLRRYRLGQLGLRLQPKNGGRALTSSGRAVSDFNPESPEDGNNFSLSSIAPYISNISNALTVLPKVPTPNLRTSLGRPNLVDYEADVSDVDRTIRSLNAGTNTGNQATTNAIRASNLATLLSERSRIRQSGKNANANILNRTREFNSEIEGQNVNILNDYQKANLERDLSQQQQRARNIANLSDKLQLAARDKRLYDLEERKLNTLPKFYEDTGVNKHFNDNLEEELKKLRPKALGGKIHIAPSKRGTFTAAAKAHGAGVQEFASRVLANKEKYSSAMVKKANFARNASKWKH